MKICQIINQEDQTREVSDGDHKSKVSLLRGRDGHVMFVGHKLCKLTSLEIYFSLR